MSRSPNRAWEHDCESDCEHLGWTAASSSHARLGHQAHAGNRHSDGRGAKQKDVLLQCREDEGQNQRRQRNDDRPVSHPEESAEYPTPRRMPMIPPLVASTTASTKSPVHLHLDATSMIQIHYTNDISRLADAVNTTNSVFDTHHVPGKVIIDQDSACLKIQAFRSSIRA
jgi:hypothetical protein